MTAEQVLYIGGALAVLALLFAVLRMMRGRRSAAGIEEEWEEDEAPGRAADAADDHAGDAPPDPEGEDRPARRHGGGLEILLEPCKLSVGLVNATLSCELTLANRGREPMVALRIGSDMLSAHASRPNEEHLRGPDMQRATVQKVPRLDPGESVSLPAELVLPLAEIQPVAQGEGYAILPLVRLRVVGAGTPPVIRTALVGRPPGEEGGRLKLFPLDAGPKIYTAISARMLE